MERDIFNIIEEKEFHELTAAEREELQEMCTTEDEYNNLKMVLSQVHEMQPEMPADATKESLDNLFAQQSYPKAAPIWYNSVLTVLVPKDRKWHQQPLVRIVAILLLVLAVVPFFNNSQLENPVQVAQNEVAQEELNISQETKNDDAFNGGAKTINQSEPALEKDVDDFSSSAGNAEMKNFSVEENEQFFDEVASRPTSFSLTDKTAEAEQFDDLNIAATRATAPASIFNHPDAGFTPVESNVKQSVSVGANDDVLDLLTVCF